MTGFHSEIERLVEHAGRFKDLSGRAGRISDDLKRALDAVGDCWGSDDIGRSFAAKHVEPSRSALGRVGSLGEQVAAMGTRFADTAATYQRAEEQGLAALRSVDHDR